MDQYITNNNRPTNLFCTANIVENLFIVTNNNNILTLNPFTTEAHFYVLNAIAFSTKKRALVVKGLNR